MIPSITEFVPLTNQWEVIRDIRQRFDYSLGTHEILLSGSVGSAKSLLLAHIMSTHCLMYPRAHFGVGRRVFKDLKDTLLSVTQQHLDRDVPVKYNGTTGVFTFQNGSIIRPFSWADRHYKKFRSHEFTGFAIEELTENDEEEFYEEIFNRIGRRRDVPEKILINATNPDDPAHWAYQRFFVNKNATRHVYKTKTKDNPYLPASYVTNLKANMDPRMWLRMGEGEWIPIRTHMIYHQYDSEKNYRDYPYPPKKEAAIRWCWDFNIAEGKPLSSMFMQHIGGQFHCYQDLVIEGFRTEDMLEEALERGLLEEDTVYIIHGDATGRHSDTRSRHHDYDIIRKWLSNARTKSGKPIAFRIEVPLTNPKIRERHNIVNAQLCNANGARSLFVYKGAQTLHKGLMLTKLKEDADYVEDDTKPYQHVTTALGYGVVWILRELTKGAEVTTYRR